MAWSSWATGFLRLFGLRLQSSSGPNADIAARYLVKRDEFLPESGRVKPRALEPWRRDLRTSVFVITGLAEDAIWELGRRHVEPTRGPVLARADLAERAITQVGLRLERDDNPPRHASIAGWPSDKHAWRSIAQELAAAAELHVRPGEPAERPGYEPPG